MVDQTDSFSLLHRRVQKWCSDQGWQSLRDIQTEAIPSVLARNTDIIIAAATAAGKTEAAFLPACSAMLSSEHTGVGVLYISPLKALINDQHRRLEQLGEALGISVTPWHGDVKSGVKNQFKRNPQGILLITPESLESKLMNHSGSLQASLNNLCFVVIDEFHSFIGSERGQQLLSQLSRLEFLLERTIPRIALSATLGEMDRVASVLGDGRGFPCTLVEGKKSSSRPVIEYMSVVSATDEREGASMSAGKSRYLPGVYRKISEDLFSESYDGFNLIFTNSREETENISSRLSELCVAQGVENQFFPHHGSLSPEHREMVESRLQSRGKYTSAVCTMTLELGIDIGEVDRVSQVFPPSSVASLRQRLGRSGRRTGKPYLKLYIPEEPVCETSHMTDRLRISTFQTVSILDLLLSGSFETPNEDNLHLSTLVQQTLSLICQYGSVRAEQIWTLLCKKGPFKNISVDCFKQFLIAIGHSELISQNSDGSFVLGIVGEEVVNRYTFYAAFSTQVEYSLEFNGKIIGSLPATRPVAEGQFVVFGGSRWVVKEVIPERYKIKLEPAGQGVAPKFTGQGPMVNDIVRDRMFMVYRHGQAPSYLDEDGIALFREGQNFFKELRLEDKPVLDYLGSVYILVWKGDRVIATLAAYLSHHKVKVTRIGPVIECGQEDRTTVVRLLREILGTAKPTVIELLDAARTKSEEKFDRYLTDELKSLSFANRVFDIKGAEAWVRENSSNF